MADKSFLTQVGNKVAQRILDSSIRWLNERSDNYTTYRQRPKFERDIGTQPDKTLDRESAAIIMQGPLPVPDDFARETLAIYRRHMPEVRLLLSTWIDTPEEHLAPIRALGVDVVLSEKPEIPGHFNINMQLVSAKAGIAKAIDDGAVWIMKTRVDQRLYNPNVIAELIAMAKAFPPSGSFDQKYRIFGIGYGSLKYAPYHVTDQTVFGHALDMLKYWTPPLRNETLPVHFPDLDSDIYLRMPLGEVCRHAAPECYFASRYLAQIGRDLNWTIQDSWAAFRDCFCFIDYQTTDFFWQKTQLYTRLELLHRYDAPWTRHEITFAHWMLLYTGMLEPDAATRFENAQELHFMDKMDVL